MYKIHYALQTCDRSNSQNILRYCGEPKSTVTQKCVTSFLNSVKYTADLKPDTHHTICIFDDHSSQETVDYLQRLAASYTQHNIAVEVVQLDSQGIMPSIKACYQWLLANGQNLVYQVQDDYLFEASAIFEMIDVFNQLQLDTNSHAIVVPYHDPRYWRTIYRYSPTPRAVIPGANRYWIQCYDIPCTFMTSIAQFSQHQDLYEQFFLKDPTDQTIEPDTINKILVNRNVLGLMPFESLALHMQSKFEQDPYIDWQSRWNQVQLI